jgi:hypothetical protein
MIKIVATGRSTFKILDYIKNQNFYGKKENYQFFFVDDHDNFKEVTFKDTDLIIVISSLICDTSSKFMHMITREATNEKIDVKNIVILPFSFEGGGQKVNSMLRRLININQDVLVYPSDDVLKSSDLDATPDELIRKNDDIIYKYILENINHKVNNIIISEASEGITYQALATFDEKKLIVTLLNPSFTKIDSITIKGESSINFGIKDKKIRKSTEDQEKKEQKIHDVDLVSRKMLLKYIKQKS